MLTPNERTILSSIARSIREVGYPPTIKEIAAAVGLNPYQVSRILKNLEGKKIIKRERRKPRAIKLLKAKITIEVMA